MEEIIEALEKSKMNLRLLGKLYPKMEKSILYKLSSKELRDAIDSLKCLEEIKKC
jgi:hypothetical protein